MQKVIDLVGQKFGKLEVVEQSGTKPKDGAQWLCKCDCGSMTVVPGYRLRNGKTKSCGCMRTQVRNDLTGQRIGRLTVIRQAPKIGERTAWECACDCGNYCVVTTHDLTSGKKRSCGCLRHENKSTMTHGKSKERIHKEWRGILHRCKNPSASHWENYGGRGITVCDEWKNDFIAFYNWSMDNGYTDDLTLDRIDNDKGYSPDNCRWVTHMENCHNRGARKDSQTGYAGVQPRELADGRISYRVVITTNYKRVTIGSFETLEEAISARKAAEAKYWGKKEGD